MPPLPPRDRALLHFLDSRAHLAQGPSEALTQQGTARALDVNRTHITRVLKPLVDQGLLEVKKGRPEGGERKLTYYVLTPLGLSKAKEMVAIIGEERLEVVQGGRRVGMTVAQALASFPGTGALQAADSMGGVLKPTSVGGRLIDSRTDLSLRHFHGRGEQLAKAAGFIASEALALAVYANHGYGSSTFLRKVAVDLFPGPVLWHDLAADGGADALGARLQSFAAKLGLEGLAGLREEPALICLDNYRDVGEAVVDMLMELMAQLSGGRAKLAVAMREETPSYERFYLRADVVAGKVVEAHLHRFDEATAKKMIGEDIDGEAFQLIYMLTRGQPLALASVRDGDEEELRKLRLSEEVRFLMYLRTRRKAK